MLKISFKSSKRPDQVLKDAESFFKRRGLKSMVREDTSIRFEGGGGYVSLDVTYRGEVTVEAREWESLAKEFAEQIR